MTQTSALQLLDSFAAEIPRLYPQSVADYRGREISSRSVAAYLHHERHRFAEIATLLPPPPRDGAHLLDLGIAYGFLPALLQGEAAWKCEGLELSENIPVYCAFAREHGVKLHAGKLGTKPLALADSSYDAIIFSEVLEHLRLSPSLVFRELDRILAPGGFLLLTTPNFARLTNVLKLLGGRNILEPFPEGIDSENITDHLTHIREYTMREVCSLLEKYGFLIGQSRFSSCMEKDRAHGWITTFVPSWRGNLIVLAQKRG